MTREVKWPAGYEPENVAIYATNSVTIDAEPETVWKRIVDAERWTDYYPHATDIHIVGGEKVLGPNSRFNWKSMGGMDIVSWVTLYEPFKRIGWMAELTDDPGATAFHQWVLTPGDGGLHVASEETQKGAFFDEIARTKPDTLRDLHQVWVDELRRVAEADERTGD